MPMQRRAKIVATVGPASSDPAVLRQLVEAGVNTFRLNFSHGSHADHARNFAAIREIEAQSGRPIGILQDLQGPKIRIGVVRGGPRLIAPGETICFTLRIDDTEPAAIPLPHPEIFAAIASGQELLLDDGRVRLRVTEHAPERLVAEVVSGTVLSDRKGVNLPGTRLAISPLTAKDRSDLQFGLDLGVDWVALSFVQSAEDVIEAKALIDGRAGLISKIEKPQALEDIDRIVAMSDGIMVARGDLGVEIPPENVPGCQKDIVDLCRSIGRPVIVATQMLESMIAAPVPTRAETSDVATAIFDGADAVMLSAETAAGKFPVESVAMMDRVIRKTEAHPRCQRQASATIRSFAPPNQAISSCSAILADATGAAAIIGFSESGATMARITRERPRVPVLALTPNLPVVRRGCLYWGLDCRLSGRATDLDELAEIACEAALAFGYARSGDNIVLVAGTPVGIPGSTNTLKLLALSGPGTKPAGKREAETAPATANLVASTSAGNGKAVLGP